MIKRAKQLLAEAGYDAKRPLRITLRHVSGNEEKRVNLAVAGMWRQLGVQTQLQQGTMNAHFADLRQGDFDVAWAAGSVRATPNITSVTGIRRRRRQLRRLSQREVRSTHRASAHPGRHRDAQ